ncbi:MAG TPA: hypothetical protein VHN59_01040 [Chitinophagaceae bacterium]|nr:hypothetical protein [Chitinophagaceae bacterium]
MPVKTLPRKRAVRKTRSKTKKKGDIAESYNAVKKFGNKQYTGMAVGRSHKWYYDKGVWRETKITPDLWRVAYAVTKRRAGEAPEGSGVPVGTAYHWYILAHQRVEKLNANDYSTSLIGMKYKLAHRRADKNKWSAKTPTQRKHLIDFLKEILHQLESEVMSLEFEYKDQVYKGEAVPLPETCINGVCYQLDITLNDENMGIARYMKSGWKLDKSDDKKFVEALGNEIMSHYK